jgi:hypothetical protein
MPPVVPNRSAGWRPAAPFMVIAALAMVAGGLVSAALAHAPTRHAMWLVAYLVLVVGVAQFGLGIGQSWLARALPSTGLLVGECGLFNVGNVFVMAGTLAGHVAWVSVGTLLLIVALSLFFFGVRRAPGRPLLHAYRAMLLLVVASALVGLLLATLRANA